MRSVRLGQELEARLEELSSQTGQPVSEIIRRAVRKHFDNVKSQAASDRLKDLIGVGSSKAYRAKSRRGGGRGARSFAELLDRDEKRNRRPLD